MTRIALALVAAAGVCAAHVQPAAASTKKSSSNGRVAVEGHVTAVSGVLDGTLTFDREVQVPGATLPAGRYRFTLVPPTAMRVTNEDGTKVYATFDTTPIARELTTTHAHVRFERMPDGTTRLVGLYAEGASSGYSPLYKTHKQAGAPIATAGSE
jgi:hypothetical protein